MKHLLNNLSEEEKNSIREQHHGGVNIDTSRFKMLLESTLGNVKPLVEQNRPDRDVAYYDGDVESDCDTLLDEMDFVFDEIMDFYEKFNYDVESPEDIYDRLHSKLGKVLSVAEEWECENLRELDSLFIEYLDKFKEITGL
jgi:hypothetical protein